MVVVIDATAVHLARTQLLDAADAAALDAADSIDVVGTYRAADSSAPAGTDPARRLVLTDGSVRRQAEAYLAGYEPPTRVDGVTIAPGTGSADGRSATVVLSGRVRLPMAGLVVQAWSGGVGVTVWSTAVAPVQPAGP